MSNIKSPKIGARDTCTMCGAPIVYVGPYWQHAGEQQPRHPATPGGTKK